MFPYFDIGGTKIYMTGIGIIVCLATFLIVAKYLTKKFRQDFSKIFFWLPSLILLTYFLGAYVSFALSIGFFPATFEQLLILVSPYGYKFHFIGIVLGILIAIISFLKKIRMYENKNIWIDIFFYSITLSIVPLGLFLVLGDDFIGKVTHGSIGIKPLHTGSALNKFGAVYPIGIFVSIAGLISAGAIFFWKRFQKKYGLGLIGFAILIFLLNVIFMFQQYPRYGVIPVGRLTFDIKQYVSFLLIMICIYVYHRRDLLSKESHT